jgi:hypothetical protein
LRKIAIGGAVGHIAEAAVGALEIVMVRAGGEIFLKQRFVGLVASRVDVGDVVGDDIHLPFQRHLPR